ncbi:MAG: ATP-grasp domain-containing protein [wastewater metagenome]|nr:ATP-grasp domain-containing protein [Candidatus Loosdrechtia aerotolerans]
MVLVVGDILLTYAWVRSSYAALRNLHSHGLEVVAADSYPFGMCQWSRLKKDFVRYPSHYDGEDEFVETIARLCDKYAIRLLMPSHNETEILARNRRRLPEKACAILPEAEHCELFNNKARSYELAQSVGLPLPGRVSYSAPGEVSVAVTKAGLRRVVVKLLTGNSAKGIFYADTPEQAEEIVRRLIKEYSLPVERYPQIEERIYGEGWGCSALYWHGEPISLFCHRRLREKIATGGTSTLRESARNDRLREMTQTLLGKIGWHGLAMVEYKVCPDTGKIWFIEVNPRLWGSLPLAISAGAEFPYLAWLCATEGPGAARRYQENAIIRYPWRGRWLMGDLMIAATQCAHLKPLQAWRTVFSGNCDAIDDLHLDDPFAFLGEVFHYGSRFLVNMSNNPAEKGMVG